MPAATGKLTICAANTYAAASPARGTCASFRASRDCRRAAAIAPALMTPVPTAVPAVRNPSGACMRFLVANGSQVATMLSRTVRNWKGWGLSGRHPDQAARDRAKRWRNSPATHAARSAGAGFGKAIESTAVSEA